MDMFFETGGETGLSLDEMLAGDIKSELEFELGLIGVGGEGLAFNHHHHRGVVDDDDYLGSSGGEEYWDSSSGSPHASSVQWATASLHSSLNLDLSVDPAAGIMVNPNSVMPVIKRDHHHLASKQHVNNKRDSEPAVQIKKEIKQEHDERGAELNEESGDREQYEEEEEEEGDDDEDDEDEDEEEEDDEEEEEVEEEEAREQQQQRPAERRRIQVSSHPAKLNSMIDHKSKNLWTTLVTKPVNNSGVSSNGGQRSAAGSGSRISVDSVRQNGATRYINYHVKPPTHHHHTLKLTQSNKQKRETNSSRSVLLEKYAVMGDYPKPAYSYSCLIAMALKNSRTGSLPVSEIYNFMCEHFPYFKSAPAGWKNSVRHNLSLNKCFEKIEKVSPSNGGAQRKGCLWAMNPSKITKMDDEVAKWSKKDPQAIRRAMKFPETLEKLERGDMKIGPREVEVKSEESDESDTESNQSSQVSDQEDDEEDDDPGTEDEGEVPPSLKPFDSRLNTSLIVATDNNLTNDLGVEFSEDIYEELGLLQQVLNGEDEIDLFGTPTKRQRLECVVTTSPHHPITRHVISSQQ